MIERTMYLEKVRPFYNKNIIKIITGIRRSGKSTLLLQIIDDLILKGINQSQIIYINLDDFENEKLKNKNILYDYIKEKIVTNNKNYLFIDEIQEVEGFEKVVNSFNINDNVDIYLTGSNSKMLASEFATYLTGRYISFEVFPFSFKEIYLNSPEVDKEKLFLDYVEFGGFPQSLMFSESKDKKALLSDLYNSIVIKDLTNRYKIRDVSSLEKYLLYLSNTIASLFSAENITAYFKNEGRAISKETLYNYINYAKEAYFIYTARRYDIKGKKLLSTNEKIFINDQGFRGVFFNNQKDIEKVLENIVYFELLRRGYEVYVGNINGNEVDFIAQKGEQKHYFQVAYLLASKETIEREFKSLLSIDDQFPKYVITTDRFNMSQKGIIHKNIIDFLLE